MLNKDLLLKRLKNAKSKKLHYRFWRTGKNLLKKLKIKSLRKSNEIEYTTAKLFTGATLNVVLPDNVSVSTYLAGYFENEDSKAVVKLLNPGNVFVDIGAHIGYFSRVAADLVGPHGKIYSFEPTPSTFELLSQNMEEVSYAVQENMALYSTSGELSFNDFGTRYMVFNSFRSPRLMNIELKPKVINVKTITADEYFSENDIIPNLIKIDAESAEYDILLGMENTLLKHSPILLVEVGDFSEVVQNNTRTIILTLKKFGYNSFVYQNDMFLPHKMLEEGDYKVANLYFSKKENII